MKSDLRLLLALLAFSVGGCSDRAELETFLIEKGYRGKINIIFNQTKGQAERYENGRRIYEIPTNGILLTQFKDNYGLMAQQFFYVDANGKREPLKKLDVRSFNEEWTTTKNANEPSRDELGVFFAARVGVYGNSDSPQSLRFQEFFVSTYSELKTYHDHKYQEGFLRTIMNLTGVQF